MVDNISDMISCLKRQIQLFGLNQLDRDIAHSLFKRQNSEWKTKKN